jgi:uncharacterized protein (DUF362 family)
MPQVYIGDTGDSLPAHLLRGFEASGWEELIHPGVRVAIKPNYCWPEVEPGVTTTGAVLEETLRLLATRTDQVSVVESDGISFSAEQAFAAHSTAEICERHGAKLVNLSKGLSALRRVDVLGRTIELEMPSYLLDEIDVLITMPVLKTHVITGVSLGMKNLWGCLPDSMRVLKHHILSPGIVALSMALKPRLAIIDCTYGLDRRGPVFGDPIPVGKLIVSDNVLVADATATRLLGFDPAAIDHLRLAADAGLGTIQHDHIEVVGDFPRPSHAFSVQPTIVDQLSNLTYRSAAVTRLIHGSPLSKPIYAATKRTLPVPNRSSRQVVG